MTLGMTLGVYQCLLCLQYLIQTMMTTLIMNLFSNTASFIFFPLNEKSYIAGVRVFLRVTLMTLFFSLVYIFQARCRKIKWFIVSGLSIKQTQFTLCCVQILHANISI